MGDTDNELEGILRMQDEKPASHKSIEDEYSFYKDIQSGNLNVLLNEIDDAPASGMGVLSDDSLRNLKYRLIIMISMIARFCIEGGLDADIAYAMNGMFVRQIDVANDEDTLLKIKKTAVTNYTLFMHNFITRGTQSPHVSKAEKYVRQHLSEPVDIAKMAEKIGVNADYLTKLFKKETGLTLSQYILHEKCEAAKCLLENSGASCTEISSFLGFSSCSHFIDRFKRVEGITPSQYRKNAASGTR